MLQKCGPFELLRHIATGGMAEIYVARQRAVPTRLVVIKRMLPELAARPNFIEMFIQEGRLTSALQHPHIVRVLEVGHADDDYFIAMELVDGPHLGALFAHSLRARQALPLELCAWIVARAAEGLEYAHTLTDPTTGKPLHLVHRDVSPQNILISKHGDVKVTDFGVAKASTQQTKTRTGILKGKVSYMSPEQCLGDALDHRTDVFALGIVLYELLTRRRLFRDKSELLIMQRITGEDVTPASSVNALIDPALDAIVTQSLARDLAHRHQSAGELARSLDGWLRVAGHRVDETVLARWFDAHCPELAPTAVLAELATGVEAALEPPRVASLTPQRPPTVDTLAPAADEDEDDKTEATGISTLASTMSLVPEAGTKNVSSDTVVLRLLDPVDSTSPPARAEIARPWAAVSVLVAVATVGAAAFFFGWGGGTKPLDPASAAVTPTGPLKTGTLAVQTVPADVPIVVGDRVVGRSPLVLQHPIGPVTVQAQFPDQRAQQQELVVAADQQTAASFLALVPVVVRSVPAKATVRINGELMGETPFDRGFLVAPNAPLTVHLDPPGPAWQAIDQDVVPKAGEPLVVEVTLPRAAKRPSPVADTGMGKLSIRTDPDGVVVSIGKDRIDETPFAERSMKAGRHTLLLRKADVGLDERLPVTIPKDATLVVKLRFEKDGSTWKLTSKTIR
jgi:serine/threonine protein kinase